MSKLIKAIKNNKIILGIILVGLFLRLYNAAEWYMYTHDHDLLGWFVKDIVLNNDLRLIGQETSQHGVFIGPLFYYAVVPFYMLTNLDPIGGVLLVALISAFGIWSMWYVFRQMFGKVAGYTGAIVYATAYSTILTEREVVPTMPVFVWSIWFLYSLHLLLKGKQKSAWLLLGILFGLVWHLNMGLILLAPVAVLAFIFSRKKIDVRGMTKGALIALVLLLPFIIFEARHGFIQVQAILSSGTETVSVPLIDKFNRVIQLVSKNIYRIFFAEVVPLTHMQAFVLMIAGLVFITWKKIISSKLAILIWVWIVVYILFFSVNSISVSEYYLNGMYSLWIAIFSIIVSYLYHKKGLLRLLGVLMLISVVLINFIGYSRHPVNESGYVERKAIIQEIKRDSMLRGYDCVSLSFITSPGSNLGYRYFTWLEGLKTKPVSENVPVYTIVYPHSLVDEIDKDIGALGLIYPDYERYNDQRIAESCEGENFNTSEPLFGYTK